MSTYTDHLTTALNSLKLSQKLLSVTAFPGPLEPVTKFFHLIKTITEEQIARAA